MRTAMKHVCLLTAAWAATATFYAGTAYASTTYDSIMSVYRTGKASQALDMIENQLGNQKDPQLLLLKGVILADLGRNKDARSIFQALIVDYPQLPEPYNNLAVLYAAEGDYEKAKTVLEIAIKTNPSYATAHENLGDIYAKLASISYAKALNLKPQKELQPKLKLINQVVALTPAAAGPGASSTSNAVGSTNTESKRGPEKLPTTATTGTDKDRTRPTDSDRASALDDVRAAIEKWRIAWTNRNIEQYLESYQPNYTPNNKTTHQQWVNERTARIVGRKNIEVTISNLELKQLADGRVSAQFEQHYRSDILDNKTRKTLVLERINDRWVIVSEKTS